MAGLPPQAFSIRPSPWGVAFVNYLRQDPEKIERLKWAQKSLEGSAPCRLPPEISLPKSSSFFTFFSISFESSFSYFSTSFLLPLGLHFHPFSSPRALFLSKPPSFHFLRPSGAFPTFSPSQCWFFSHKIKKKPPWNLCVFYNVSK